MEEKNFHNPPLSPIINLWEAEIPKGMGVDLLVGPTSIHSDWTVSRPRHLLNIFTNT
jgi:hypothetical protein